MLFNVEKRHFLCLECILCLFKSKWLLTIKNKAFEHTVELLSLPHPYLEEIGLDVQNFRYYRISIPIFVSTCIHQN